MIINNLKELLPFIEFDSPDDFYYLQIIQRKKDNPHLGSNSRVIKNYYIRSKDHLIEKMDEIILLCDMMNARASFRVNRRSFVKVAYKALVNMANTIHNGEFRFVSKAYDRACGQNHNEPKKKWIIDIDSTDESYLDGVISKISSLLDRGRKIYVTIPSPSGWHIITSPFRLDEFKKDYPEIDIHKDNPTNLYTTV